jgi:methylase of polypeptide subunit release factors
VLSTYLAQQLAAGRPAASPPFTIACDVNAAACDATRRTAQQNTVAAYIDAVCCDLVGPLLARLQVRGSEPWRQFCAECKKLH